MSLLDGRRFSESWGRLETRRKSLTEKVAKLAKAATGLIKEVEDEVSDSDSQGGNWGCAASWFLWLPWAGTIPILRVSAWESAMGAMNRCVALIFGWGGGAEPPQKKT